MLNFSKTVGPIGLNFRLQARETFSKNWNMNEWEFL